MQDNFICQKTLELKASAFLLLFIMVRNNRSTRLVAALGEANNTMRRAMIRSGDKQFIDTLLKCIKLLILNPQSLTPDEQRAIRQHSNNIHLILHHKTSNRLRKQKLQSGGFLNLILPAIGNLLSGLLNPRR